MVDNIFLTLVLACLASSGLASIIVAVLNRKWSKDDKEDDRIGALVTANKVIMIDRYRWLAKQHISSKCISLEDKESMKDMYDAYKALGGNGHLDACKAEIDKLPVSAENCTDR